MFEIRAATKFDVLIIREILCESYRYVANVEKYSEEQLTFLLSERASVELINRDVDSGGCFVACENGDVLGVICNTKNEITKLYVKPSFHKKGIGTQLLRLMVGNLFEKGHSKIVLGTTERNIPFYEKNGFVAVSKKVATGIMKPNIVVIMESSSKEENS